MAVLATSARVHVRRKPLNNAVSGKHTTVDREVAAHHECTHGSVFLSQDIRLVGKVRLILTAIDKNKAGVPIGISIAFIGRIRPAAPAAQAYEDTRQYVCLFQQQLWRQQAPFDNSAKEHCTNGTSVKLSFKFQSPSGLKGLMGLYPDAGQAICSSKVRVSSEFIGRKPSMCQHHGSWVLLFAGQLIPPIPGVRAPTS